MATAYPLQLTSLVGREQELVEVQRLLGTTRLLTLAGVGGIGKTRLALAAVEALSKEHPHRVAFVELASLVDPALLTGTIAAKLGVREWTGRSVHDTLLDALRQRTLLLLLDNCEHLIEACAVLANDLLRACAGVRILATSREPLRISGELTWRVPPLPAPEPFQSYAPDELVEYPAVRLFIERARRVHPSFVVTLENATAVASICTRLDGMPLAIELAAAQTRILAPDQILTKLDDALQLLVGGRRAAPTRQRTCPCRRWLANYATCGASAGHQLQKLFPYTTLVSGRWLTPRLLRLTPVKPWPANRMAVGSRGLIAEHSQTLRLLFAFGVIERAVIHSALTRGIQSRKSDALAGNQACAAPEHGKIAGRAIIEY